MCDKVRVMIFSAINPKQKTGYYNAVTDRVMELKKNELLDVRAYSFYKSDSYFCFNLRNECGIAYFGYPKLLPSTGLFSCILLFLITLSMTIIYYHFKPNIVHAHWGYPIGYCAAILKRITSRVKLITTFHGSDVHTHPLRSNDVFKRTHYAILNSDVVTAVSSSLANQIMKIFNFESEVIVTHNGIAFEEIITLNSSHSKNRVFSYFGNLNKIKGADRIPDLYCSLRHSFGSDFVFYVAGTGPLSDNILKFIESNKIDNLIMLGEISRSEVYKIMSISDCVFVLSREEGLGISAIEALIYSRLCIAINVGGLSEVFVEHEDLLIDEFIAKNIVDKYIKLEASEYEVSKKPIIEKFSLRKCVMNEVNIYLCCIEQEAI